MVHTFLSRNVQAFICLHFYYEMFFYFGITSAAPSVARSQYLSQKALATQRLLLWQNDIKIGAER